MTIYNDTPLNQLSNLELETIMQDIQEELESREKQKAQIAIEKLASALHEVLDNDDIDIVFFDNDNGAMSISDICEIFETTTNITFKFKGE
jgi:hypothetical protein